MTPLIINASIRGSYFIDSINRYLGPLNSDFNSSSSPMDNASRIILYVIVAVLGVGMGGLATIPDDFESRIRAHRAPKTEKAVVPASARARILFFISNFILQK